MKTVAPETRIVKGAPAEADGIPDLVPPIHMTSAFGFRDADHGARLFAGEETGYIYSRLANPTVTRLQQKMAYLEEGQDAIATASGMAAIAATALTLAQPDDNFISCTTLYGGSFAFFTQRLKALRIEARLIPPSAGGTAAVIESLCDERTRFLFLETPANPTLDIIDIAQWAAVADRRGIPLVVDNTFATPYLQQPLRLGAAIVVHSATKYIGGHADCIGGIIAGSGAMMNRIREGYHHLYGPALSPFNAWLFLRGLKTLAVRMQRHCSNAAALAEWLAVHPAIAAVHYPGLPTHPAHALARKQMRFFGGMLAFEVKGGLAAGKTLLNRVELCRLAVSLGDCDTLIQHPASMTHASYTPAARMTAGISDGLIRLSVGIEHVDDIRADLGAALAAL